MEQCKLCSAKLWSNTDFAPQNLRRKFLRVFFFVIHCNFRDLYNHCDHFLIKNILRDGNFNKSGKFTKIKDESGQHLVHQRQDSLGVRETIKNLNK